MESSELLVHVVQHRQYHQCELLVHVGQHRQYHQCECCNCLGQSPFLCVLCAFYFFFFLIYFG